MKAQLQRPFNQWKFFLQKNLNNIALDLLTVDAERTYAVDYKDFMKVIDRRSKIPEYLKNDSGTFLSEYIAEFTNQETGKIEYKGLIDELRKFDYEKAN